MSLFESILYGIVTGFTEFLPVSSQGHQALMLQLMGIESRDPLRDLLVHIGSLVALFMACKPFFLRIRRTSIIIKRSRRRNRQEPIAYFDLRLIKTAAVPLTIGLLFYSRTEVIESNLLWLVLFFFINGLVIIIPEYIRHGNKDARFMTNLDGIVMGAIGALSAFPGLSRIGIMNAYTLSRGVDRQPALNWLLALSVPATILFCGFDIVSLLSYDIVATSFSTVIAYLLSGVCSYVGAYFGVILIKFLAVRTGFSGFAYYSWGTSIFSFVLYLIA